jgi:hypothetical protein
MKFKRVYEALKAYGFSAAKAAEILLDARRNSRYARQFVGLACRSRSHEK